MFDAYVLSFELVAAKRKKFTKDEAIGMVAPYIVLINGFQSVDREIAKDLMGETSYSILLTDGPRNCGPTKGTIYPWNVIDYLIGAIPAR